MELIENEKLAVEINPQGATLSSVKDKFSGEELLWQGASDSWTSKDVIIFPFVARLKNKSYTLNGKRYEMEKHGVLRKYLFEIAHKTSDSLTLRARADAETKKQYPFDFAFTVSFALTGNSLSVAMSVENTSDQTMYFGMGAHPAYALPAERIADTDDISGNRIVFDAPADFKRYVLDPKGEFIVSAEDYGTLKKIELNKKLFADLATLILEGKTSGLTLERKDGYRIHFALNNSPILAFWTHPQRGAYICVEPWCGLPDFEACSSEMKEKSHINALEQGKKFSYAYTTTYLGRN